MSMQWVRRRYGVPAKRGGRVIFAGNPGRITAAKGGHLRVTLDSGRRVITHPRWRMVYLGADGAPVGPPPIE